MTTASISEAFEVVIGLECHAQLHTRSKMFCRCSTDYSGGDPNTHVCPVCMGMPGVLPVINAQAVEYTIMTGLALNCEIPEYAKFDRKNYPYPDLMKGYQVSEFDQPLCINGYVDVEVEGKKTRIRVNRVHLEEDTARLLHRNDGYGDGYSLLDVNRAGMPLMEIVTEPDARSPEEAVAYLMKLRQTLRYLGVSDADMEAGNFRCEPNLSLRPRGSTEFGSKVELKNLNSFRAALRGMQFEVERQGAILLAGGRVASETRGWREETQETASQRSKEQAHDYRYFPEPDLPPLLVTRGEVAELKARLPELPDSRKARFIDDYGLSEYEANLLTESRARAEFFEAALFAEENTSSSGEATSPERLRERAKPISNWLLGDLGKLLNAEGIEISDSKIRPAQLSSLVGLIEAGKISGSAAKQVIEEMFRSGNDPETVVSEKGLGQIEDTGVIDAAVAKVLEANPGPAADYRAGKVAALNMLVGQVMKETRGRANAAQVQALLRAELDKPL
jgi:aspartyl-tRNA(Asn)/glutamyl-tRNA(Gln) amidotransferase subunit B